MKGTMRFMYSGQHAENDGGILGRILRLLVMVLIVFGLSWLLRTFVFQPYEIPSGSMEDTIETNDLIFAEKVSYYFRSVQPGDIVTFNDPEVPGRTLIKRVVAVNGQTVDLVDGHVCVDGVALNEPYTDGKPSNPLDGPLSAQITYPYTVPEGQIWVMGDNRTNSQDSRYFGSVSESSVTGHAVFVYWPFNHIGPLS